MAAPATTQMYPPAAGNPAEAAAPAAPAGPMAFIMAHKQLVLGVIVLGVIIMMMQKPKKLAAAGGTCKTDDDCTSGACAVGNARAPHSSKKCCTGGNKVKHLFRDYCADLPVGAACRNNDMCASGKCHGNLFGLTVGKCK